MTLNNEVIRKDRNMLTIGTDKKLFLVSEKNKIELEAISDIEIDEETGYMVEDVLKEFVELTPSNLSTINLIKNIKWWFVFTDTEWSKVKALLKKLEIQGGGELKFI